ncbi:hypothetical protein A2671_01505 [Candidatus Kaiserbacteria bacterium RIFCSPHIGHO2_01_FULL_49_13]|uniref:Uncharacterized protein n=1 Tax=Candidatus Kaiserbacteria bacterium RIFCSPHIGHO2_01_FULL_49_13 TaxID=1798477 RepID=A0A1F6CEC7_9BACT|nr:MAG: hypothetical protein A2671_01505 [Candidatus Kaiserbacteria bacterium RIFCSPHIGHO2_01_FULL_49_13]
MDKYHLIYNEKGNSAFGDWFFDADSDEAAVLRAKTFLSEDRREGISLYRIVASKTDFETGA